MKTKKIEMETIGLVEIISLIVMFSLGTILFSAIVFIATDLTSQDPVYWINQHLIYGIIAMNMIFKVIILQVFIFSLSLLYKLFVNPDHKILIVGIDYINFIRGKEMHSMKFLEPQFSKLAESAF